MRNHLRTNDAARTGRPAFRHLPRLPRRWALAAVAPLLLGACDIFEGVSPPETARITVSASGDEPLQLIVSTNFITFFDETTGDQSVEFFEADTTMIPISFDQSYSIRTPLRFAARVSDPTTETTREISMEAFIDGDRKYNSTHELTAEDFMQFIFIFN